MEEQHKLKILLWGDFVYYSFNFKNRNKVLLQILIELQFDTNAKATLLK